MTSTITNPSIRKAALLVRSLDGDSAALLLAQLSPQEARAVRQAVRELGEIDPDEQEELAIELRAQRANTSLPEGPGIELNLSTAVAISEPAIEIAPAPAPTSQTNSHSPFAWLEHGDLPTLANVLEREHLSTVAVVLSHLPPQRGADLLAALPPGRRVAAIERMADLGESDRASLEVIEKSLADWIAQQKRERQLRADRLQAVRALLSHASSDTRKALLTEMARTDNRLASELNVPLANSAPRTQPVPEWAPRQAGQVSHLRVSRPASDSVAKQPALSATNAATPAPAPIPAPAPALPRFDFWQLTQLDQHDLGVLFAHCDAESLVLALAGGSDEIMTHVLNHLPTAAGRQLQRRVNHISQIRLSDVARAQQRLALAAAQLMASGKLHYRPKA